MADTTLSASQSTVSPNFANYINDMMTKGWGAAQQPFQPFAGQRFADTQPALQQAFTGIQSLATSPTSYTDAGVAQKYMNPYTQNVVDAQQREAQRQAGIANTQRNAQFVKAGAFGGSRQGIENAEAERNLQNRLSDIQSLGLNEAYKQGTAQFNTEQGRQLTGLQNLFDVGKYQQAQAQQPLDFGYQQWQDSLKLPYEQATFMGSLLSGMPMKATPYMDTNTLGGNLMSGGLNALALYNLFNKP